jgi:hypothetical protein
MQIMFYAFLKNSDKLKCKKSWPDIQNKNYKLLNIKINLFILYILLICSKMSMYLLSKKFNYFI